MLKKTRSILDELDSLRIVKDKHNLIESKANHLIQGTINLINFIKENYDTAHAEELERRLINSIRSHDPGKFSKGLKRITNENKNK